MSKPILDIWEKPVKYPRRQVRAWVGSFASDCLGDYKTPRAAISAAKRYGYRTLHIIYRDGTSQVFDTQQGRGGVVTDDPTNSQRGSWAFAGETKTHRVAQRFSRTTSKHQGKLYLLDTQD